MSDTPVTPRGSRTRVYALKAAKELFDARGRHATTLSDFTSACGVQKDNLHLHFEAKEDLALALIEKTRKEYLSYRRPNERGNARWKRSKARSTTCSLFTRQGVPQRGCIFDDTALETGDTQPQFRAKASPGMHSGNGRPC